MQRLTGKHIVVTGASAGIGAELCRMLGDEGCRVMLAARRIDRLEAVAAEVIKRGGKASVFQCDVTNKDEVFNLATAAREAFGEIDVWVSNAGAGVRHELLNATEEDMLWMFHLNCLSSLWAYQAVIPAWKERGYGQVIDINSISGKSGFAWGGGYVSAKGAMSCMGDAMRQELLGTGIHVTTVYPGLVESDFRDVLFDRTEGRIAGGTGELKEKSALVRKLFSIQSSEDVCKTIIRAMKRPVPTVYPHRWTSFAVLLFNLFPAKALKLMEKTWKQQSD